MPAPDSAYGTLTASTIATVTLARDREWVEVLNRNGAAEIFFTVDGSNPTVAGAGTFCVPAIAGAAVKVAAPEAATTSVKLISSGIPTYGVLGL